MATQHQLSCNEIGDLAVIKGIFFQLELDYP